MESVKKMIKMDWNHSNNLYPWREYESNFSIKPQFANMIFEGSKQFEFRKAIFKNRDIKKVIVYASPPVQKVIGEFEIDRIISNNPRIIWRQTNSLSGISEGCFFEYFHDREVAYAI